MRTDQIECIVFREKSGTREFLLLKRTPKKGGFWQPVCGGVEKNDLSLLDAAFRELKEEVGIKKEDILKILENVHHFEISKHYLTGKQIPTIKEHVFAFKVKIGTPITIDKNTPCEHEEITWVPINEALKLLKWEDNKEGLTRLNELLTKTLNQN